MISEELTIVSVRKTWYVYLLCDPDTEVPFYVGKGTGSRIYDHERSIDSRWHAMNEEKNRIIRQILAEGKEVLKKIVAEFEIERDAYIYEWALINLFHEHITNIRTAGGGILSHEVRETSIGVLQASEILGILRKELRNMVWKGEIGYSTIEGMFFYMSELHDYLATHAMTTNDLIASCSEIIDSPRVPNPPLVFEDILEADEVGKMLKIHPRTVKRLANLGELPGFKVGGQWRFRREAIEEYIRRQEQQHGDQKSDS